MKALTNALATQRLHHAYLFTGTRGVGKTTLSRILAKSLNCVGVDGFGGVTPRACGLCPNCLDIDANRHVDYVEMDAASNRGVDDMAHILEQAVYAPTAARFKVYMIDEVHMLTNHAFNAMLKTLEEPPSHVKFILATTDPQKIPVTVLSRCLQFNLKQMTTQQLSDHLCRVLNLEEVQFERSALGLLARGARGSVRDALSLTDQVMAFGAGSVSLDAARAMLGASDQMEIIRILDAVKGRDGPRLIEIANDMTLKCVSLSAALQEIASLLNQLSLVQTIPSILSDDIPDREDIVRLSNLFTAEELIRCYRIAIHGRNEMHLAPDEFAGFTMTLFRMLAFVPSESGYSS